MVIYWMYDIGGANQGRTKALCDTFADLCGCEVVLVDVYLGDGTDWQDIPTFLKSYNMQNCLPRYMKVMEAEKRKIAAIGTCWGTLATMTIFAESKGLDFLCGIQYHPSTKACGMEGVDEWELTAKVTVPQLILAAENDVDEYKPGGASILSLEKTAPGS